MNSIPVLNISIENTTTNKLLEEMNCRFLLPLNIDVAMKFQRDRKFYELYKQHQKETFVVLDSQIIKTLVFIILGKRFVEKIYGSDFFPAFCRYHKKNDKIKIFLLGGMDGVAAEARDILNKDANRDIVVDAISPTFGFEKKSDECDRLIKQINQSGANVLALGVGAPKQEKWFYTHADKMPNIKYFFAVGATIDFIANKAKRAPRWISSAGLEWLYRLVQEPKRLARRYLIESVPFPFLLIKQRFGKYHSPFSGA